MLKRFFDIVTAFGLLIVLAPVFLLLSLAIRFNLGSPIFFRQERPGLHGRPFALIKFRSMRDGYDEKGQLLPDGERLTSLGRFFRSSSLDELPELWNVLVGEMSLVGPRPLLMEYLPLYSPEQARRHEVRPGITGWAQVNGRNALDWEKRFQLDVWYVDNQSLSLDLKICVKTLSQVVSHQGVTAEGHATMPKFTGNEEK